MSGQDVPNFAVAPTSSCGDLTEDWLDLDALFEGEFFPEDVGYDALFDGTETGIPLSSGPLQQPSIISPQLRDAQRETGNRKADSGTEPESDENVVERRDRNREHAKQSRIRKRVLLDTLQDQLTELRAQNAKLRRVVADRLPPELASQVLLQCTTEESTLLAPAHESDTATPSNGHASTSHSSTSKDPKILMEPDYRLMHSLIHSQQNFLLTDPAQPDNPIVYASEGFCKLTGYKRTEVLGRNCRFLQGPGTDPTAVKLIRQGISEGRDVSVCLLNYRADGSAFWNQFFLAALKDAQGKIVNYVGVQCAANTLPVESLKERVKRLPLPGV